MPAEANAVAKGVLRSVSDDVMVLDVPGTEYQLHLVHAELSTPPGKRIRGVIHATALRMHPVAAGGRFIEPIYGAPRIIAGTVTAVDEVNRRVLVETALPMWVTWPDGQDTSFLREGQLVSFHVESGVRFEEKD